MYQENYGKEKDGKKIIQENGKRILLLCSADWKEDYSQERVETCRSYCENHYRLRWL